MGKKSWLIETAWVLGVITGQGKTMFNVVNVKQRKLCLRSGIM